MNLNLNRLPAWLYCLSLAGAMLTQPTLATASDFPTLTRVEYVEACRQQFDRPPQELIYKCSCAIDKIAEEIDHDTWIALLTFNNAAPIAGERGAYLRERKDTRTKVKSYRELQAKARQSCFLPAEAKQ
ncbi:MAG: hypothetical protein AB8C46_20560 [Burkholderiaceae bacterium]